MQWMFLSVPRFGDRSLHGTTAEQSPSLHIDRARSCAALGLPESKMCSWVRASGRGITVLRRNVADMYVPYGLVPPINQ